MAVVFVGKAERGERVDYEAISKAPPIVLMRHGEVKCLKWPALPPPEARLNADGRAQARAAAEVLAPIPFDRVVTSGLSRTLDTAQIVVAARDLPIKTVPALQEIRGGRMIDLPPDELRHVFLNSLTHHLTEDGQFLRGERFGDFRDRVVPAFQALLADPGWQNLLLVSAWGC